MTTITATPNVATATVKLTLVKTMTVAQVLRTDANGTRPVRVIAGEMPSTGAGTVTLVDYEAALTGPVMYQANEAIAWAQFPAGQPARFTLPLSPTATLTVDPTRVTDYTHTRESSATVHQIIGRPDDPIVVRGRLRSRTGKLSVGCDTYQTARELTAILQNGYDVLFRQPGLAGADLYFTVRSVSVQPEEEWWATEIEYMEVKAPTADRPAASVWDFTDLAALPGSSFGSIAEDYASFVDLTLNEPS